MVTIVSMGIQDRDYYREHWRKRQAEEDAVERKAKGRPVRVERVGGAPPPLWGADWHWSLKVLVWLAIVVLGLVARRLLYPS